MLGGLELSEKLPDELFRIVEDFKKFIREQKAYKDQKFEIESILEVDKDADDFMLAFQRVAVDNDINSRLIQQIRNDTTKLLRRAEMAYSLLRTHQQQQPQTGHHQQMFQQTFQQPQSSFLQPQQQQSQHQQPAQNSFLNQSNLFGQFQSSQQQNLSQQQQQQFSNAQQSNQQSLFGSSLSQQQQQQQQPLTTTKVNQGDSLNQSSCHHFAELADQFEAKMRAYGEQIKDLKMSLDSLVKTHNADELFKWLKKQHETLGEIAAKVYMTHERIMEASAKNSIPA